MAESKPSGKRGGHAYGRRKLELSNTAEEGELCLYGGHAMSRYSSHSMRYDSHAACVRCVAAAREGRLSFDINRLVKKNRKKALKFWSQVDIGAPDDCWNWHGYVNAKTSQPQFPWRRPGISSSTQHHPQRVAMWLSWGDLGFTGVKTTCGNKFCCNPMHLIPQKIGVFVDNDTYLDSFELACQIYALKQQVADFVMEEAIKESEKLDQTQEIAERTQLLFDETAQFDSRYEAVLTDILEGRHITQVGLNDPGLFIKPPEDTGDEEPT